jgi:hypothetical protein
MNTPWKRFFEEAAPLKVTPWGFEVCVGGVCFYVQYILYYDASGVLYHSERLYRNRSTVHNQQEISSTK